MNGRGSITCLAGLYRIWSRELSQLIFMPPSPINLSFFFFPCSFHISIPILIGSLIIVQSFAFRICC